MATYKVIQDIEAEDKLLGPLTLKQFVYAIIVVVSGFIAFKLGAVAWYLALPFIFPMIFFGIMAAPLGRDQPTEVWLVAKLRFFLKPRLRIWNQSGQLDYVTITVPKKVDPNSYSNNLSQTEVKSRLKALSNTIDTRGWAVKNVNTNLFAQPKLASQLATPSDRLLEVEVASQTAVTSNVKVNADEDILDEENNPVAQQLDQMISASTTAHRQETLKNMQKVRERMAQIKQVRADPDEPSSTYWFMGQNRSKQDLPSGYATFTAQNFSASTPGTSQPSANDQTVLAQAKELQTKQSASYANMHTIAPLGNTSQQPSDQGQTTSRQVPSPAILGLANNDDLNVATIARQANQKGLPEDEVSISLR